MLDENSFMEILTELDTIPDLTDYLEKKEKLIEEYPSLDLDRDEKSILSVYIHNGRNFPEGPPPLIVDRGNWERLIRNEQYQEEKNAIERSYVWDNLIEHISDFVLKGEMEFDNSLSDDETVLRYIARENRFSRFFLSDIFKDFLVGAKANKVKSRMTQSPSGIGYVFLNSPPEYNRQSRIAELGVRCFIARNEINNCKTIIGIGFNIEPAKKGHAIDLYLLSTETWPEKNKKEAERIKKESGFFNNPESKTYDDLK